MCRSRPTIVNRTICPNSKSLGQHWKTSILKCCKRRFAACMTPGKLFKNGGMDSHASRSLDNSSLLCFHSSRQIPLLGTTSICRRLAMSPWACLVRFLMDSRSSRCGYWRKRVERNGMWWFRFSLMSLFLISPSTEDLSGLTWDWNDSQRCRMVAFLSAPSFSSLNTASWNCCNEE